MSWRIDLKLREATRREHSPQETEANLLDQIVIRQAKKSDLLAMEWEGEYTHFRRVYAEAYERMKMGYSILWVAELPDVGLIGQVFIQLTCERHELADGVERAYLYSFRVRKKYRSLGIGSRMMAVVENDLRKRGFASITLNVARDNPRAQQLYQRRGYHVVAPEPGIWSYPDENGRWHRVEEPAWRMEKVL